jgi:hypothetical protein
VIKTFNPTILSKFAIANIIGVALIRIYFRTNLFADGSYQLFYNIENGKPLFTGGREFIQLIDQFLTTTLINLVEVSNTSLLSISMGVGYILIPGTLICLGIWNMRSNEKFWGLFTFAGVLVFFFSGSIGESLPAFAVIYLASSLIIKLGELKRFERFGLTILLLVSIRSYETNVLYLSLLLILYVIKSRELKKSKFFGLNILLIVTGIVSSAKWLFFPYGGNSNRNSIFAAGVLTANPGFRGFVAALLISFILTLLWGLFGRFFTIPNQILLVTSLFLATYLSISSPLTLSLQYHSRVHIQIPFILILILVIFMEFTKSTLSIPTKAIATYLISICIIGTILNLQLSKEWWGFTNRFQQAQVDFNSQDSIPINELNLVEKDRHFIWAWTNESMSIVLRTDPQNAIITHDQSYTGTTYVDLGVLPRLSQYYWR